jgi:hypothetical protein
VGRYDYPIVVVVGAFFSRDPNIIIAITEQSPENIIHAQQQKQCKKKGKP